MQKISKTARVECDLPEYVNVGENVLIKQSRIGNMLSVGRDTVILESVVGENCSIEKRNLIRCSDIGRFSYTGSGTSVMWAEIGSFCSISRLVDIGANEHDIDRATTMPSYMFRSLMGNLVKHPDEEKIYIGNDVWIGQGVTVIRKKGMSIGNGVVIGSGAVVTKSIPDYAIATGIPARVTGYRFSEEIIKRLLAIKWWDWPIEKIKKNWQTLSERLDEEKLSFLELQNEEDK